MWACVVFSQPCTDTLVMEPMLTGQNSNFFANVDLVHAYTAFCLVFRSKHLFVDLLPWQAVDVGWLGWWGSVRSCRLFHELGDDAVESFLRVHEVTHVAARPDHAKGAEKLEEWVGGVQVCIAIAILFPSKLCFGATSMMVSGVKATWWSSQCSHESSDYVCNVIHRLHPRFWIVRIPRKQSCSARICES